MHWTRVLIRFEPGGMHIEGVTIVDAHKLIISTSMMIK